MAGPMPLTRAQRAVPRGAIDRIEGDAGDRVFIQVHQRRGDLAAQQPPGKHCFSAKRTLGAVRGRVRTVEGKEGQASIREVRDIGCRIGNVVVQGILADAEEAVRSILRPASISKASRRVIFWRTSVTAVAGATEVLWMRRSRYILIASRSRTCCAGNQPWF